MMIQTKYFGEQEISEDAVIRFSFGLPGFEQDKRFIIQPFGEAFSVLQSADHEAVAFIVTSPFLFLKDYSINLPDAFVRQLDIDNEKDVSVWMIVSVHDPFPESTVNMRAPVIINERKRLGRQYIPEQSGYALRTPIASFLGKQV